ELGDTIPVTMQNELVYEIAGEFCETLCRLLSEHPPQSSDPVSALRKLSPDWHLQLPLVHPCLFFLSVVFVVFLFVDFGGRCIFILK
ncbi:hypothetical protein, partial [Corynebacterium diphtheriae]|uniref:hypothetical protein n=1 Tax=Corynebacterium diphtheriae TaxID=1717 RepID=UPI001C628F3B